MFIAHLPAGYLLTRRLVHTPRVSTSSGVPEGQIRWLVAAGLAASVAPDVDLFWFYFVDGRQVHHHHYWPHLPAVCGALFAVSLFFAVATHSAFLKRLVVVVGASWGLHLVLDTLVGYIKWAWPWSERMVAFFQVPATSSHWILNFVLHWSFGFELLLVAIALRTWWGDRQRGRNSRGFGLG